MCGDAFNFFKQKTAYEIYQCDWSSDVALPIWAVATRGDHRCSARSSTAWAAVMGVRVAAGADVRGAGDPGAGAALRHIRLAVGRVADLRAGAGAAAAVRGPRLRGGAAAAADGVDGWAG